MNINGHLKTTTLDYPEHLATTIFLGGCNFRCPFCHNKDLVIGTFINKISEKDFFEFLKKRKNILEGVCITGGEPTLREELPEFIKKIKAFNFKVKLDTNGSNPSMLKYLLQNNLIDYVAMDIKNSKDNYLETIGINKLKFENVEKSIEVICKSNIDFEFRTTVIKEFHEVKDIINIAKWLQNEYNKSNSTNQLKYFLQQFEKSDNQIVSGFNSYSEKEMLEFTKEAKKYIPLTNVRGIY